VDLVKQKKNVKNVDIYFGVNNNMVVESETSIIIQSKLELIYNLLLILGDDDKKLFSFLRKEVREVIELFKQL